MGYRDGGSDLTCSSGGNDCQEKVEWNSSEGWQYNAHELISWKIGNPLVGVTPPPTNDGDWAHSDTAHTLTVGTDYVAEITRGNIGAGADEAFIDYNNPTTALDKFNFDCTGYDPCGNVVSGDNDADGIFGDTTTGVSLSLIHI